MAPPPEGPSQTPTRPVTLRIGIGHVGGRALVAGQDVGDAVVEPLERVVERQAGVAAQAEDMAHAVQL